MSKIHSNNTSPELILKRAIRRLGFSYQPKMFGNPDFIHKKKKIVIFVDGDFWHGYNWRILGKTPPKEYWQEKIRKNIARDKRYNKELKKIGFSVLRFWEHDVINEIGKVLERIKKVYNA